MYFSGSFYDHETVGMPPRDKEFIAILPDEHKTSELRTIVLCITWDTETMDTIKASYDLDEVRHNIKTISVDVWGCMSTMLRPAGT